MPRNHKDFAFSSGDDAYSNAFIEGVISTAPTRSSEMKTKKSHSENQAAHDEWASNVYSRYDPDDYEGNGRRNKWTCASVYVAVMSVLLLLIGMGMFALGIVEEHHKQILPLCPGCHMFITGIYIAGACLVLMSIMGFMSAKTRFGCLSIPFAVLMILMGLAFLIIGIAAVLYGTGTRNLDIEKLWTNAVENDPHFICSLQSDLKCSGYGQFCCFSNSSVVPNSDGSESSSGASASGNQLLEADIEATDAAGKTAEYCWTLDAQGNVPAGVLTHCSPDCAFSNGYSTPCDSALQDKIKQYLVPIAGSVFPLGILMFLTGIASIKMTCRK